MNLSQILDAFLELGDRLTHLPKSEKELWFRMANNQNNWFTPSSIELSLRGITRYLQKKELVDWVSKYPLQGISNKTVGVIMAGNIPLVGFHDFLCVLLSGHRLKLKLSSQDCFLFKQIIQILNDIQPQLTSRIEIAQMLKNVDAYIATGSDNSARYFEYYFSKFPNIIRKNRTSVAVLTGQESKDDLLNLGHDILDYFGLGCRNVSKIYVPENYDFYDFMKTIEEHFTPNAHHKYRNNYDYNKSIYLVNREPHLDNEQILIREDSSLVSPIAVVYYEKYSSSRDILQKLSRDDSKIQCVVSNQGQYLRGVQFGQAQHPNLWNYADDIDTMAFLSNL